MSMAFSIKNEEADRIVRELAERTGEGITDVILSALRAELKRVSGRRSGLGLGDDIARMQDRIAALPVLDDRCDDDIMGYDEAGLPE
jgi:antitoxin VapB